MLNFSLVSLAKNHNFFAQIDTYMKELARISISLPNTALQQRLESALNKEFAILNSNSSVLDK